LKTPRWVRVCVCVCVSPHLNSDISYRFLRNFVRNLSPQKTF